MLTIGQIDHFPESGRYVPHTNATFKQRYFFDSSYYKPGGPVFLYIGGETSGESRFSNLQTGSELQSTYTGEYLQLTHTVIQILMQEFNGLGVILENRYYGESYPYNTSTTDELRFLTTEQSKETRILKIVRVTKMSSNCRQCLLQTARHFSRSQRYPKWP